jgi:hydroxymethylglutaryl-CoA lyase
VTEAPEVSLVEVGPRDGLQNEAKPIPTGDKIAFVEALAAAGLRRIEAAAFVSSKAVPQLADGEAVLLGLRREPGVVYGALVPNETGFERALRAEADEIAVFTAASEAFTRRNINASVDESFARFAPVAAAAKARGLPLRGYVSTVAWCPFSGRIEPDAVVRVVARLFDLGCYEASLGETIGRATPGEIRRLCEALRSAGLLARCAGHFHDTYGMAAANVLTAFEAGVRTFDSSAGGLGGCPFAPGAAGNAATEDLVYLFDGLGVRTGVDLERVVDAAAALEGPLGRPLPSRVHRAVRSRRRAADSPETRS